MTTQGQPSVRFALIGAGRIGTRHAELLARHVPGCSAGPRGRSARPDAADRPSLGRSAPGSAHRVAAGACRRRVDAVVIAATSDGPRRAGGRRRSGRQGGFCEKPMAMTLADADRAIAAAASRPGCRSRSASTAGSPRTSRRRARRDRRRRDRYAAADALAHPRPRRLADPGARAALDDLPRDPDPRLRHAALAQPGRRAGRGLRDGRRAGRPGVQGRAGCSTPPSW